MEYFTKWAQGRDWQLEPVPWAPESFFVDREDRSEALGKDLLHTLGATYMQEAASMLPVALLDPQPGETILDMSAAPGSKTTQIAARMQGRGVVIANDMQDKRLWTLCSALQRSGVTNVVVTKKVGQWFSKHMTERFDRVLIDAPCTAQGTLRKDPTALTYSSDLSIGKAAKLQRELLESAINATKVGGRIVYSTCTLTPEENEEVVAAILSKFSDQVKPLDLGLIPFSESLKQSHQDALKIDPKAVSSVRLWPQTYDTEGFFCAVLEKTAPTRAIEHMDWVHRKEDPLSRVLIGEFAKTLTDKFGASFIREHETLLEIEGKLTLATRESVDMGLPMVDFAIGLPFGKRLRDNVISLDHDLVTLRGNEAQTSTMELDEKTAKDFLKGKDIPCDPNLHDQVLVMYKGLCVGRGKGLQGTLKNNLPRWMVQLSQ